MEIALVIPKLGGGMGGYTINLMNSLSSKGHIIHLYTTDDHPEIPQVVLHHVSRLNVRFLELRNISFEMLTRRMLRKSRFDVVIGFEKTIRQDVFRVGSGCHRAFMRHYYNSYKNPIARLFGKARLKHRVLLYMEKKQFQKPNYVKIIANSRMVKEDIMSLYNVPDGDIIVIYNGVDNERFHPDNRSRFKMTIRERYGISKEDFLILFVGKGFKRKGVRFLIQAAADLKKMKLAPNFKILIVGHESKARTYRNLSQKRGLQGQVIYTKSSQPNIEEYYAAADAFVFPTLYDPFANVCLEAMASGLPVITSQNNGASEIICDDMNGYVLDDPTNHTVLARKIALLFDPVRRQRLGRNARKTAEGYSINSHVDKVLQVLREAAVMRASSF